MTRVYLDTSGWNALHDWSLRASLKRLRGPEYLFSSCNLDEFVVAGYHRARDLASFAWRISNRRKLLDHLELTTAEISGFQGRPWPDYPFDTDPGFEPAWRHVRHHGATIQELARLRGMSETGPTPMRNWLRDGRSVFGSAFKMFRELGVARPWEQTLRELRDEGHIGRMIAGLLDEEGLTRLVPKPHSIAEIPYDQLPGTATWVQYYLALAYLAAEGSGRISRPDLGDQTDFRHAAYAGIADVFVTDDRKMLHALTELVPSVRAQVLTTQQFLEQRQGSHSPG